MPTKKIIAETDTKLTAAQQTARAQLRAQLDDLKAKANALVRTLTDPDCLQAGSEGDLEHARGAMHDLHHLGEILGAGAALIQANGCTHTKPAGSALDLLLGRAQGGSGGGMFGGGGSA